MKKKLIITGASGFLGRKLCLQAVKNWNVYGLIHKHIFSQNGVTVLKIDLTSLSDLKKFFLNIKPDALIHTAAISDPNFCQENPEQSFKLNVESSINLSILCSDLEIPFIFCSTDLVFDGLNPPYSENDIVCPVNTYGKHKVLAEKGIIKIYADSLICRLPLLYGYPESGNRGLKKMLTDLENNRTVKLFSDEYRSPVSAESAATGILELLGKNSGLLHLGGRESISRYDFGLLVAELYNYSSDLIEKILQLDVPMPAPRSIDVSLISKQAYSLGYKPGLLREELKRINTNLKKK
ncbi:NAD(P)-dependent oxidoreductase [bacterium]|nr:NAD(P)-dependent oxidoreductase [bacterium]